LECSPVQHEGLFGVSYINCGMCFTPFLSTGNGDATPSTVRPSNTHKHVAPYQTCPRLEPQKKSKSHKGKKEIMQALISYLCCIFT